MIGIQGLDALGGIGGMQPPAGMDEVTGFVDSLAQAQEAVGADKSTVPPVQEAVAPMGVQGVAAGEGGRSV